MSTPITIDRHRNRIVLLGAAMMTLLAGTSQGTPLFTEQFDYTPNGPWYSGPYLSAQSAWNAAEPQPDSYGVVTGLTYPNKAVVGAAAGEAPSLPGGEQFSHHLPGLARESTDGGSCHRCCLEQFAERCQFVRQITDPSPVVLLAGKGLTGKDRTQGQWQRAVTQSPQHVRLGQSPSRQLQLKTVGFALQMVTVVKGFGLTQGNSLHRNPFRAQNLQSA